MRQLREFAQQTDEFTRLNTRIIAVTADGPEHARQSWERAALKRFSILTDPEAKVIREYGLVQVHEKKRPDSAIRATFLLDAKGVVRWVEISRTANQTPKPEVLLEALRKQPAP